MTDSIGSPQPSAGLCLPWSWCGRCQRAYTTGSYRVRRFLPDALHPHPTTLKLCPYTDCSGSTIGQGWLWTTFQHDHPDYPTIPERNVVYAR